MITVLLHYRNYSIDFHKCICIEDSEQHTAADVLPGGERTDNFVQSPDCHFDKWL